MTNQRETQTGTALVRRPGLRAIHRTTRRAGTLDQSGVPPIPAPKRSKPVTTPPPAEPRAAAQPDSSIWNTRDRHRQLCAIVGDILSEQPSSNAVRSAARRINSTVSQIAEEIAKRAAGR